MDQPGLPGGKWEPVSGRRGCRHVVVAASAHSAEAWGARRRKLWAPRNGARSSPSRLSSAGVQLTSAQGGGLRDRSPLGGGFGLCPREKVRKECAHPAASRALLPRYPAPAWSPLEAARDQGPQGPRFPHGLHAAVVCAPFGRRETTLPAQRAFPSVAVTWLGPTPSGGDRDKPVSAGQCLWKREGDVSEEGELRGLQGPGLGPPKFTCGSPNHTRGR